MRRLYSLYAGLSHHFLALCRLPCTCVTAGKQTQTAWNTCILSIGYSFILINGRRENYSHVVRENVSSEGCEANVKLIEYGSVSSSHLQGPERLKTPIFHFAAAHPCHLTSAIKRTTVPRRPQILQSCALVLPRVIVPPLRSCISLARLLCAVKLAVHVSHNNDGQCDHSHLSPHSCTATCILHLHGSRRN